ncbi:hypothetical protein WMF20_17500 [Sorangium sp. So ce834]|uniref:hypothetical protein n=1 Tax=Sorangium sp. So ce834 TaxID=3133321 RepID=UPI003F6383E1
MSIRNPAPESGDGAARRCERANENRTMREPCANDARTMRERGANENAAEARDEIVNGENCERRRKVLDFLKLDEHPGVR